MSGITNAFEIASADAQSPEGRPLASALRVLALQEFFPLLPDPAAQSER